MSAGQGCPGLPRWAARAVGLREAQRGLVVLEDGRVEFAHLVPEVEAVPVRGPSRGMTSPDFCGARYETQESAQGRANHSVMGQWGGGV